MTHTDIVVLGGGISGLAAACALQDSRADFRLLERRPVLGGLTRTVEVGDFCFDYTGHFLHLRRYASPAAIPFAGLRDDDWMSVTRRSHCYVVETMVTAPIQYHLGELPLDIRNRCIASYEERPHIDGMPPQTFREYLLRNFGHALSELFLIPQNEKTLAIPLDRLSPDAAKRFFPVPDDAVIRRGMSGRPVTAAGYNSSFWYPRAGGIEALVRGFARRLERFAVNHEVCAVDLERHQLRTTSGLDLRWDALLTSAPLPVFCRMTGEPSLVQAAKQLTHSSTLSVNIGLRGTVALPLQDSHWVYVPDRTIPFYRVGVYSNICEGVCSPGHSAIYAEVGLPAENLGALDRAAVQNQVVATLERLGWLQLRNVECVVVHALDCAYVHFTPASRTLVEQIGERLSRAHVYPIGRYGRWDYTSMEDSIYDGLTTAKTLLQ